MFDLQTVLCFWWNALWLKCLLFDYNLKTFFSPDKQKHANKISLNVQFYIHFTNMYNTHRNINLRKQQDTQTLHDKTHPPYTLTHSHTHFKHPGEDLDSTEGSWVINIAMVTGNTVMQASMMSLNKSVVHSLRVFMLPQGFLYFCYWAKSGSEIAEQQDKSGRISQRGLILSKYMNRASAEHVCYQLCIRVTTQEWKCFTCPSGERRQR